jgi:hypothetical protein
VENVYKDIGLMMLITVVTFVTLLVKLVLVQLIPNVLYVTLVTSYIMDTVFPHVQMVSMPMKLPENVNSVTVLV